MNTTTIIRGGLAAVALSLAPLAAQAADLPFPAYKAPPFVAPVYANWRGPYLGVNAGYGFGTSDWDIPAVSVDPSGAVAGGTLGYNLQTGLWVWGMEGDFNWSGIKSDEACGAGTCETEATWLATARARLGYAGWNNWLPYITGGLAVADVKASNSDVGEASDTLFGWTAGAGIEYASLRNWSIKLEYLYADLGSVDCSTCNFGGVASDVSFKTSIVRAGVNYRF
jgi:outer membrane immunogenic protein